MNYLFLLLLLSATSALARHTHKDRNGRLVGGREIPIEEAPYQLAMMNPSTVFACGAIIISEEYVISAAHCVRDNPPAYIVSFRAGSADRTDGGVMVTAAEYWLHPLFAPTEPPEPTETTEEWSTTEEPTTTEEMETTTTEEPEPETTEPPRPSIPYDLAVIRLEKPLKFSAKIQAATLVNRDDEVAPGASVTISGWGKAGTSLFPRILRATNVTVWTREYCEAAWPEEIDDTMVCAAAPGRDACVGDRGGPVVKDGVVVGIMSWGSENCSDLRPGVFTKLSNPELRDFITDITGI